MFKLDVSSNKNPGEGGGGGGGGQGPSPPPPHLLGYDYLAKYLETGGEGGVLPSPSMAGNGGKVGGLTPPVGKEKEEEGEEGGFLPYRPEPGVEEGGVGGGKGGGKVNGHEASMA